MTIRALLLLKLLCSATLNAQTDVQVEARRQEWNENLTNISLEFRSEANRRYLIEVSEDLSDWETHYSAPFEYSDDGYMVRQLDLSNPYTSHAEFYRVLQLPWAFQALDDSGDWIGDVSLTSNGNEAFIVYQNRDTNTLFYSVSDPNGRFGPPSEIESTGAVDEPSFWDNSGFSDVTLIHYGNALYLICTDDIEKKVILLKKDDGATEWIRHEVSGVIDSHYWAFPKFAISSTGVLGVAYRNNEGTVFSYSGHLNPEDWQSVFLTNDYPNSSADLNATFRSDSAANIFIKNDGSFRVRTTDGSVTSEPYPDDPPTDLSPEEMKSVDSTTRNETLSNHVRLQDGRIVLALSNGQGIIMAVEDQ